MGRTDYLFRFLRGSAYAASMALFQGVSALQASGAVRAQLQEGYGRLPLSFEANQGQTDSRVRFQSRGPGYTLFLTPTEAVLALRSAQAQDGVTGDGDKGTASTSRPAEESHQTDATARNKRMVLRMQLLDANPHPKMQGLEELPGKVNYFIGENPGKWRTGIPTYSKVKYHAVYPGVDFVYYGKQRQLEFDFIVAPGGDPNTIRLNVEGPDRLEVDSHGDLVLHSGDGQVRLAKPFVYQTANGAKHPVSGSYVLKGPHQIGFQVAAYDGSRPLVIDPTLDYSTYLGSTGSDDGFGIAVDVTGNSYVTGFASSTDFPTTAGTFDASFNGGDDVFVTKLNPTGAGLVYSTYLGGSGSERARGIAVDIAGNAHITGQTGSMNFPTTTGVFDTSFNSGGDAFVTKLNPTGAGLVYSTYLGGTGTDEGIGIAVDVAGNVYVTGSTNSTAFPTTVGAFDTSFNLNNDAFVTKLDPTGAGLIYSTYLGGTGSDFSRGFAVDGAGNGYVIGLTSSTNFPTTTGAFDTTLNGSDAFVTKLDPAGAGLVYSTYLGGTGNDDGFGIALDVPGNAYVTGATASADFPTTTGAFNTTTNGLADAFVTKLNPAGAGLVYSTYLGGAGDEIGFGIAIDVVGNAYVTGSTRSTNFPTTPGAFQTAFGGGSVDGFVTKLNTSGTGLVYSTYLGGAALDAGRAVASDVASNAYVIGVTSSTNFPTTAGAYDTMSNGSNDAFVAKISDVPPDRIAFASTRDGNSEIYVMNADGSGQTRLTTDPANDAAPAWSPNQTKIAFASTRDGNSEIYVMNADGTGQTRLTNEAAVDALPAWSPDGMKIAFASTRDGNSEIYVMNADGSLPTRLTSNGAVDTWPAWSPDGARIAFTTDRHGVTNYEIYVMNADGSLPTRLTNNPAVDVDPDWSPDGLSIAFPTNRHGFANFEIYVIAVSGLVETRLTTNTAVDGEPVWSPDGTKIAFSTNRDGFANSEIYVMNADGSVPTRLTTQPQLDISPAW